jgi:hypothetical protein
MKKVKIAELKLELGILNRQQKKDIKGGGFIYGDGNCRPYYGAPVCIYNAAPRNTSGYCTCPPVPC